MNHTPTGAVATPVPGNFGTGHQCANCGRRLDVGPHCMAASCSTGTWVHDHSGLPFCDDGWADVAHPVTAAAAFTASVPLSARELLVQPPAEGPTTDAPNVHPIRRPTGKRKPAS